MNRSDRSQLAKLSIQLKTILDEIEILAVEKPGKTSTKTASAMAKTAWADLVLVEKRRLWIWAQAHDPVFSANDCRRGIEAVKNWALSNGKTKQDWVATIMGAMSEGWALKRNGKLPQPGSERGYTEPDAAAEAHYDRMEAALKSLQAQEDRTYTMEEIEAEAGRSSS